MNSGIYKITNLVNNKIYIGKSVELKQRLSKHLSELRGNYHVNKHLQNSFNKYGESAFTFEPIIFCDESLLNEYEIDLIYLSESYNPNIGYNLTMGGDGQRVTEETRLKMTGKNNHFFGKNHKESSKKLQSIARQGKPPINKFSAEKRQSIIDNWNIFNISQRSLANILGVSQSALRKVILSMSKN
jgi:group I intron endonuclease